MAWCMLALALLLFLAGSTPIAIAGSSGRLLKSSHESTVLDVDAVRQSLLHRPAKGAIDEEEKNAVAEKEEEVMSIVHSSHFSAHSTRSHREVLEARLKMDAARVEAIAQRLEMALNGVKHRDLTLVHNASSSPATVFSQSEADSSSGSQVTSGLAFGSGEYFVRVGIGSPTKLQYLVMDTGSDVPWIQCSPCKSCYKQNDAVFDPRASSSFRRLSCSTPQCKLLDVKACASTDNRCLYQVSYGDGSFTVGDLASDSFSVSRGRTSPVVFGCGHDNEGLFVGAAGLLGLGAGKLSFPSQLSSRKFSYCLVSRDNGVRASSALLFGDSALPTSASFAYTQLLKNPKLDTFYYAGLSGISIGGTLLSIPSTAFKLSSSTGRGGVIIDSGTSVTRLPTYAYTVMRDAFRSATQKLPRAADFSLFDTCYDFSALTSVTIPTVSFHFEGGASVQLPPSNYLVPVDTSGTFCFAFSKTSLDLSIIGNIQQQTMRVAIDLDSSRVGFAPRQCT
ncbi:aspartyl protease family protein 2 [Selaginella moellendorffii]|nr:aspartyl protease family protein 2 [Selaginella moellendorffii]XP_024532271.1 aspartyl protease family protein 2 [Selaginella moellendorffii]XP_024532272.1 aspartyl protease family protein 2 [Selaginella moellendorffii]XP_024532273.1 aspartyl protease family protein 2 [Selaginella moellendorffii]|eukprot:XP_024532270.1 aspartyl protease family protein 2 [Selaginella moellendorffii]